MNKGFKSLILNSKFLILLIILIGGFLRFYKLDWGQGLFTHPDEYHIVISVNQLSFPNQMNPNFFSYGTASIYLIYFTKLLLTSFGISDPNVFLIGRFFSALFSTLTLIFIYKISKQILNTVTPFGSRYSLLATSLAATTPGLIQQAHLATPESTLIFYIFGVLYFLLTQKYYLAGVFYGLSLGVKISSVVLGLPILISLLFSFSQKPLIFIKKSLITYLLSLISLFIVAPFIFLDFTHFKQNLDYEGSLATGSLLVFYTRQFIETTPIVFQFEKILPYALGPMLLVSGVIGFILMGGFLVKRFSKPILILLISFGVIFLTNSFLFTKWTRFLSPAFPFFSIFTGFLFYQLSKLSLPKSFTFILYSLFFILHILYVTAFFNIYLKNDIRITASEWINQNIPEGSQILVESGNMIDVPLTGNYKKNSLDFYQLEENPQVKQQLTENLEMSDYFIIQSRRVFMNHQRLEGTFPITANFYKDFFEGKLGYKKVAEFNSFPQFTIYNLQFTIPDELAEETFSVFDHPVIRIYENKDKRLETRDRRP